MAASPQPAAASYATHKKDWQERVERGDVKVSSARELRQQLREIALMNDDSRSKIFCPNGPLAAVLPLTENKCGDRLATPSVFGRQDESWHSAHDKDNENRDTGCSKKSKNGSNAKDGSNEHQNRHGDADEASECSLLHLLDSSVDDLDGHGYGDKDQPVDVRLIKQRNHYQTVVETLQRQLTMSHVFWTRTSGRWVRLT